MASRTKGPAVLVIGGGVIGLAVAAAAADDGRPVLVLERRGQPCAEASAASFAWANAHDKQPAVYEALNRRGIDAHARLSAEQPSGERWYRPLEARADGRPVEGTGAVEVAAFARAQVERIRAAGGTVRTNAAVARVTPHPARPAVSLASGETLVAEHVVIAAGAASASLLRASGLSVPALGEGVGDRGFVVRVRVPRTPLAIDTTDELSIRPEGRGALLQSLEVERRLAADGSPATTGTVWPRIRELAAARGLMLSDDDLVEVREAHRPVARDGLPIVGEVAASVHLVVTHSGVTLAPILGELVSAELRGALQPELAPFRPHRTPQGAP